MGDHREGDPSYQRISFCWRGTSPSYTFSYVPTVIDDGRITEIPLRGNAFLRVVFTFA